MTPGGQWKASGCVGEEQGEDGESSGQFIFIQSGVEVRLCGTECDILVRTQ